MSAAREGLYIRILQHAKCRRGSGRRAIAGSRAAPDPSCPAWMHAAPPSSPAKAGAAAVRQRSSGPVAAAAVAFNLSRGTGLTGLRGSQARLGGGRTASFASGNYCAARAWARGISTPARTPVGDAVPAPLTHLILHCPVAAAVVTWVSTTLRSLTGEAGPPHSAALFLALIVKYARPSGVVAAAAPGCAHLTACCALGSAGTAAAQQTARAVAHILRARAGRPPA